MGTTCKWFAVLAALAGCHAQTYTIDWRIGSYQGTKEVHTFCVDLGPARDQETRLAAASWNKALNGWKEFSEVLPGESCQIPITAGKTDRPNVYATAHGSLQTDTHYIFAYPRLGVDVTYVVMLHELGHLLGADHVAGTLMNPSVYYDMPQCPDKSTVDQISLAWGIRQEYLSYCQRIWD